MEELFKPIIELGSLEISVATIAGLLSIVLVIMSLAFLVYTLKTKPAKSNQEGANIEDEKDETLNHELMQSWLKITSDLTETLNPIKALPDIGRSIVLTNEILSNLVKASGDNSLQHIEFLSILKNEVIPVMESAKKAVTKMNDNIDNLKPLIQELIQQLSKGFKLTEADTTAIVDKVSKKLTGAITANNATLITLIKTELDSRSTPNQNPTMVQSKDTKAKADIEKEEGRKNK